MEQQEGAAAQPSPSPVPLPVGAAEGAFPPSIAAGQAPGYTAEPAPPPVDATPPPPAATAPLRAHDYAFAIGWAAVGGLLGIAGAMVQEFRGGGPFLVFIGAPIIEEALKPAGVYVLMARWPHLMRSQRFTAALSGLSGLVFGVVESVVYLEVYFPDHEPALTVYRYTVCLALHTVCSSIAGFGINQRLLDSAEGRIPFMQGNRRWFATAVGIHAAYNTSVVVLSWMGLLKWLEPE